MNPLLLILQLLPALFAFCSSYSLLRSPCADTSFARPWMRALSSKASRETGALRSKRPDFGNVADMRAKFPDRMQLLYPGRGGFPKIAGNYTQTEHDTAIGALEVECKKNGPQFALSHVKVPFVNEDDQETMTRSGSVWSGHSALKTRNRPDFGNVADMRAKFPAQMQLLYPGRGGFPKIAGNYTQADHDTAIAARRAECKEKGLEFHMNHVKVPFVNEDGQETKVRLGHVWSGHSSLSTAVMKETANALSRTTMMAAQPKGSHTFHTFERDATDKLAQMAGTRVIHLEEDRLFDFAIDERDAEGILVYGQTAVLRMVEASGGVNSGKSIGKIKQYLGAGGSVFFLVTIDDEIMCAYVLLPLDLPWFEEATSEMKQSTGFQPYPFATRKGRGLSEVMRKFLLEPSDIKAKVREHISTGPRKPLAFLNGDPSQISADKMIEHNYLDPIMDKLSGIASRIVNQAGDLKISGVSTEFKKARLTYEPTKLYHCQIRRNAGLVTDFNEVRAFCFVVETAPQKLVYIFVPSLTAGGTCAFAPKGGGDAHRRVLCFYFDGAQFSANPEQYDESCLTDVLIVEDLEAPGVEDRIAAFMKLCEARPAMSQEEWQRVLHIPQGVQKREQDVRSRGVRVKRARRCKAWDAKDNHNVDKG